MKLQKNISTTTKLQQKKDSEEKDTDRSNDVCGKRGLSINDHKKNQKKLRPNLT